MTRSLLLALSFLTLAVAAAPSTSLAQKPDDDAGDLAPPDHANWVEHDQSATDHGTWTAPVIQTTRGAHVVYRRARNHLRP